MSMHKKPLSQIEESGLRAHGLDIGTPSQLSDVFRQGVAWGLLAQTERIAELERDNMALMTGHALQLSRIAGLEAETASLQSRDQRFSMREPAALRAQLAVAQADNAKLRKTISDEATAIAFYGDQPPQWMLDLIALPTDDSALRDALKAEREKLLAEIKAGGAHEVHRNVMGVRWVELRYKLPEGS